MGSRQTKPRKPLCLQVLVDTGIVAVKVGECRDTCDVMEPVFPGVCLSRHPQKNPGVEQRCDTTGELEVFVGDVGSRQPPNIPG